MVIYKNWLQETTKKRKKQETKKQWKKRTLATINKRKKLKFKIKQVLEI